MLSVLFLLQALDAPAPPPTHVPEPVPVPAPPPIGLSPEQVATLRAFEGEWGFTGAEPADSPWGAGLRGVGACGGPKAPRFDIRPETTPEGAVEWRLRWQQGQPYGALVRDVTEEAGRVRIIVRFLGETETYEREGDRLSVLKSGVRMSFNRCVGG